MKKYIFYLLLSIPLFNANSYALSEHMYNQCLKREDFKSADNEMNKNWNQIKSQLSKDAFNLILNNQRKWVKNGRENDVQYINDFNPVFDECRMYAISSRSRTIFLRKILNYIQSNPYYTLKDLNNFISNLDNITILNNVAKQFSPNSENTPITDDLLEYNPLGFYDANSEEDEDQTNFEITKDKNGAYNIEYTTYVYIPAEDRAKVYRFKGEKGRIKGKSIIFDVDDRGYSTATVKVDFSNPKKVTVRILSGEITWGPNPDMTYHKAQ